MADPRYTVNCSILLTDLPLRRRPAAARAAGFDAVEFWWPFDRAVLGDAEVDAFTRAVGDAGVRLSGLNFAAGDMAAGQRGLLSDPLHRNEFRDAVEVAVGIGARLGVEVFNALYGNRRAGLTAAAQEDEAVANLAHAATRAASIGATVVLEPLSGIADYPLRTAADALAVLDRVRDEAGAPALGLLADLYHLHVNGDDVAAVIDRHTARIAHVQIADAPGRGPPGTGTVDLAGHLARLAERGYRGRVGLEYQSATDPFGWLGRIPGR